MLTFVGVRVEAGQLDASGVTDSQASHSSTMMHVVIAISAVGLYDIFHPDQIPSVFHVSNSLGF